MSDESTEVPGWYGKIPALGDFASRRLANGFISQWDTWLQHSIAASRAQLAERWLDLYLASPIWRFALMPSVCGEHAWAGVLMPSVDKVGRYFPLTLAVALEPRSNIAMTIFAAHAWYAALEDVALSALRMDGSLDDLEYALTQLPFPLQPTPDAAQQPAVQALVRWWQAPLAEPLALPLAGVVQAEELISATMHTLFSAACHGKSLWWSCAPDTGVGTLHCCTGLPPPEYLVVMLQGEWQPTLQPPE